MLPFNNVKSALEAAEQLLWRTQWNKNGLGDGGFVKADVRLVIDQSGLAGWWFRDGMLGMAR